MVLWEVMPYILGSYVPMIHWTLVSLLFSMEECSRFLWNTGTYHTAECHIPAVPILNIYHNDNLIYQVYIIGNKCVHCITSIFRIPTWSHPRKKPRVPFFTPRHSAASSRLLCVYFAPANVGMPRAAVARNCGMFTAQIDDTITLQLMVYG